MSRERLENLVCIDKCAEKNGTYEMPGRCSNCYREYVLVIPKGHPAPGSFSGWRCVNCGCSRVGADHRKPAEPLPAPERTGVQLLESVYARVQEPPESESREQAVVEVMERWAMRARAVTGNNPYAEGKREAYEIAWGEMAAALARSTPTPTPLVCRICESAHFDGPGTDGTVSLADYPDHQPVYEDEDATPAPQEEQTNA